MGYLIDQTMLRCHALREGYRYVISLHFQIDDEAQPVPPSQQGRDDPQHKEKVSTIL